VVAERIGRVEFLVDLDGKNLPRQARRIGEQIGKDGGDAAGDEFNNSFSKRISGLGNEIQSVLERKGRLAGETFGRSLNRYSQTEFRKMQANLAAILSDQKVFADFARGFDSVDDAVDRLNADLDLLSNQWIKQVDDSGRVTKQWVLTRDRADELSDAAANMGESLKALNVEQAENARRAEDLESRYARLVRAVGDGDSFRKVAREVGGTNRAFERLRLELEGAGREAGASRIQIEGYVDRLAATRDNVDKVIAKEREHVRSMEAAAEQAARLEREQHSLTASLGRLSDGWSNLSHNTRQWSLIIGAIAAAMQDLAVLGSAAGAGILGLGGALSTAVTGAGGFATVLTVLSKDISELPPDLRSAAIELQGFKDEFGDLGLAITRSAVSEMPNVFERLQDSTEALTPAFSKLGSSVGVVFDDLADGLTRGSAGFEELEGVIENAAEDLPALARATGTWLTGLARGLNRANPLADQLIGYIQELGDRFDDFTQSDDFDSWVRNSMQTFTEFGELLDATGRMLNDLVTPESIVRTQQFLDNLTDFMPHLGSMLDILGRLDIFGLIAEGLADFGDALEPLAGPMAQLADELNEVAHILLDELSVVLGIAADALAPLVQGFADLLDAIPPEALAGIVTGVVSLTFALKALKGMEALAGAANAALIAGGNFGIFADATGKAERGAGRLAGTIRGLAGKAGVFGLAAVGVFILVDALEALSEEISNADDVAQNAIGANKSLGDSYRDLSNAMLTGTEDTAVAIEDMNAALNLLGDEWGRTWGNARANTDAQQLARTLNELSVPLANLAETDLPAAQDQFRAWADEVGATDQQVLNMLQHMPEFSDAIKANAAAQGELNTSADLVEAALGRQATSMGAVSDSSVWALENANLLGTGMLLLGDNTGTAGAQIDAMTGSLAGFNDAELTAREAARNFQEAIEQVTAAVDANGKTTDITTEAGRANERALDDLAVAAMENANAIAENTGSQELANVAIEDGRAALVNAATQMGISEAAANAYADELGLIPGEIESDIKTPGMSAGQRAAADLKEKLDDVDGTYNARVNVTVRGGALAGLRAGLASLPQTAIGGTFSGAQARVISEDGPEAVVPLRRPLSQVHPSVRDLSAVAQGLAPAGSSSGGRVVNVAAGAIVVEAASNPLATGVEVLDRLARDLN
jgi:hypothetical protein